MTDLKIAFIGTGFMAGAMMSGFAASGKVDPKNIYAVNEAFPESAEEAARNIGVVHAKAEDISKCSVVVFAVKPQVFEEAAEMYSEYLTADKTYYTIMAGISTDKVASRISPDGGVHVIRYMPNLALSVKESATALARGRYATDDEVKVAMDLFSTLGVICEVEESMISDVTALSGSGPAYFCLMTEAMVKAATESGMDRDTAEKLAVKTLIGTAEILKKNNISATELRARVTSKKGTTEAAVNAMLDAGFDSVINDGYKAARNRSEELGK